MFENNECREDKPVVSVIVGEHSVISDISVSPSDTSEGATTFLW